MKPATKTLVRMQAAVLAVLFAPLIISAQGSNAPQKTPASLTGRYQGTAKTPGGDMAMTLDIVEEAGKFSGTVTTPHGSFKVIKGQKADGLLTLDAEGNGSTGKFSLRVKDDKLVGDLTVDGKTGSVDLRRVAPDEISGEWDAAADAQGQPFPFTLSLKVDGEKVTGSSSSQLGTSTISSGNWKDGKLALVLESGNGQIALMATFDNGKLVGDYDFAGQFSGKWAAVKKKP